MISVVIPTCRRPDMLCLCLDRLAPGAQTLPFEQYEVLVTDDGEPTVEALLKEKYPWVSWGQGPRRGPAANRNAGAARARGEWIAFTDDDCLPSADWLSSFALAIHPGCDVYEGKTTCEAGIHSPLQHSPVNLTGGCLWSCNIFIKKSVFQKIGGFDEGYPYPYMEDADLRDRLVINGHPFEFVPAAWIDHPPRKTPPAIRLGRFHESWVYYWYKSGHRTVAVPRLFYLILITRLKTICSFRFSTDTIKAMGSLTVELAWICWRAFPWERKYRGRFRATSSK